MILGNFIFKHIKSPKEFKEFQQEYIHHSKQIFNSGLQLKMLQEYIMIPLDIFHRTMQNKPIETLLEAWLTFLANDNPERIVELITKYPEFKPLYETLYQMCRNVEDVMKMYSEELRIMDRNTVKYMIEEQQKEIEEQQKEIEEQQKEIEKQKKEIEEQQKKLKEKELKIESLMKRLEGTI